MFYPIVYLVRRCNFTWEVGELALITDYWNEAKFKHKHPVANLPAVTMEFWFTLVFNDSYTKYKNSRYIGVIIMYPKIYASSKYYEKIDRNECGVEPATPGIEVQQQINWATEVLRDRIEIGFIKQSPGTTTLFFR